MEFKITGDCIRNVETYSFEIKDMRNSSDTYYKVSVTKASYVNLYVAKFENKIHCGLIAKNEFKVGENSFGFLVAHLLPADNQSYLSCSFFNSVDKCYDVLKKVYGNGVCLEEFIHSSETLCKTSFEAISKLLEKTCKKKFIIDISKMKPKDWITGMNCLKFMDQFCIDFSIQYDDGFKENLVNSLKQENKYNLNEEVRNWCSLDTDKAWNYLNGRL